jgi:GT2 family glycosyltransferase
MRSSVLIPSYNRPSQLINCLAALARQSRAPDEVFVVWQGDDAPTRDAAESYRCKLSALRVLHSPERGVVPAENVALAASTGDIVFLIDDDAIAPPDWVARYMAHYADATVGAVGGSCVNCFIDGSRLPERAVEPIGIIRWYGRVLGNMHDHVPRWRNRPPLEVEHLVGMNMTLRRSAFDRFEPALRCYWQMFEMDACCEVRRRGYRVLFDFGNVIQHYPTNSAFVSGRDGDLKVKVYNPAYNGAFIMAKFSPTYLCPIRFLYQMTVGSVNAPGLLSCLVAARRYGRLRREIAILRRTFAAVCAGWRDGLRARRVTARANRHTDPSLPSAQRDIVLRAPTAK